jgi:large subunit ribosomal protein L6
MSRIGRLPIPVPGGVEVTTSPGRVTVTGPKGTLEQQISPDITISRDDDRLLVTRATDRADHRALHGLVRSLVANMVQGVTAGFEKRLEIQGVGYRAAARGQDLELSLGFSHTITVKPPAGVEFELPQPTVILIRGIDKQRVGQVAADIRSLKPPEPYKGKGIRYAGEHVARKVGKRA